MSKIKVIKFKGEISNTVEDYYVIQPLQSNGAYSKIFIVKDKSHKKFVLKELDVGYNVNYKLRESIKNEIDLLQKMSLCKDQLGADNLVRLIDIHDDIDH